jgi:hypothetical protein
MPVIVSDDTRIAGTSRTEELPQQEQGARSIATLPSGPDNGNITISISTSFHRINWKQWTLDPYNTIPCGDG